MPPIWAIANQIGEMHPRCAQRASDDGRYYAVKTRTCRQIDADRPDAIPKVLVSSSSLVFARDDKVDQAEYERSAE